jgi:flagellar secretion chaperone FliS
MTGYPSSRDFLRESVLSATPAQLVTMLYDRLLLDLARAEDAQLAGDPVAAGRHLVHAQDVVAELSSSLDVAAWSGGADLLAIYGYVAQRLIEANVHHDVERTRECAALLGPLRWAWHAAAGANTPTTGTEHGIAVVA